jgi:hypothetical protein
MKKYEAGEQFFELMKSHPDDFEAQIDNGRDHYIYTIRNKFRAVSVNIDAFNNVLKATDTSVGECIMFISHPTMSNMVKWANEHIEAKKIQMRIDKDNSGINTLLQFYESKEG